MKRVYINSRKSIHHDMTNALEDMNDVNSQIHDLYEEIRDHISSTKSIVSNLNTKSSRKSVWTSLNLSLDKFIKLRDMIDELSSSFTDCCEDFEVVNGFLLDAEEKNNFPVKKFKKKK